jgi:DNA invertase Pin-like site-specific DNA recombinase
MKSFAYAVTRDGDGADQYAAILLYAEQAGIEIVDSYFDPSEAIERPALRAMLTRIEALDEGVDRILVASPEHFGDQLHQTLALALFEASGIKLLAVRGTFSENPSAVALIRSILGPLALSKVEFLRASQLPSKIN